MKKLVILMGALNVVLLATIAYMVFWRVDPCVRVEELRTEIEEKYSTPLSQEERQQEINKVLESYRSMEQYPSDSQGLDSLGFAVPRAPRNSEGEIEVPEEIIADIDAMTVFRPDLVPKRVERQRLTAIFQCQRSMN